MQSKSDAELLEMVKTKQLQPHNLEAKLGDYNRAVKLRRQVVGNTDPRAAKGLRDLPVDHFDYSAVIGSCCENVVG